MQGERERVDTVKLIAEDAVLFPIRDYFSEIMMYETVMPDAFSAALSYFQNEVQSLQSIRSTVLAGLGGAVLGSVLGALLAFLLAQGV